jgi:hypothetical protein
MNNPSAFLIWLKRLLLTLWRHLVFLWRRPSKVEMPSQLTALPKEYPISRVVNGITLIGTYSIVDDVITVKTAFGNKSTQAGGSYPETLARIMLRELFDDMRTGFPSTKPDRPQ